MLKLMVLSDSVDGFDWRRQAASSLLPPPPVRALKTLLAGPGSGTDLTQYSRTTATPAGTGSESGTGYSRGSIQPLPGQQQQMSSSSNPYVPQQQPSQIRQGAAAETG